MFFQVIRIFRNYCGRIHGKIIPIVATRSEIDLAVHSLIECRKYASLCIYKHEIAVLKQLSAESYSLLPFVAIVPKSTL